MEALRALQADAVIALGGGSAVVTARASTILHAEGRDIRELCTRYSPGKQPVSPKLLQPKLPQWVVATTPTTAYGKAGTAVLDPSIGQRLTLFDPKTRAQALFVHPQLALTAPASLALDAGAQAFAMAVQGLESKSRDPLADALLVHSLRVLDRSLRKLSAEPRDAETRGQLMLGALLAGQGTDYAPSGLTSAMAHCIGARFHLPNGVTNALVLPHAMRFNAPATANRLALVAETLTARKEDNAEASVAAAISAVTQLFGDIGLPKRLREVGVPHDALPQLASDATGDWFLHQNPRAVTTESELVKVLEAAW
jgi:alcohol dehydrogenase class IV